jgi:zinc transport system permease protein
MAFLDALLRHEFLQLALIGGLLASVGCGLIGPYVVVKRIGYMAGGIAHCVLGGMGLAYYLGYPPIHGALAAAVAAALAIGWISLRWRQHEDMAIGALWACGMAAGIVLLARTPGYTVDLLGYLFGNILLVSPHELWFMLGLDVVLVLLIGLFYRQFLAVCFDEEFARLRGVRVTFFYLLLLVMVALTVVLLLQVVGLILVIALISLPAAIAGQWVRSLAAMMLLSALVGVVVTTGGLALSYGPDLPSGAVMVLLSGALFLLSSLCRGLWRRRRPAVALR